MTHPYLSDLSEPELKREVVDAKLQIETIVGHSIEHFSCPGGRYDQRTLQMARHAGFATVANSKFYANSSRTSPYELGRVAVLRDLTIEEFGAIYHGRGLEEAPSASGSLQRAARARKPSLRSPARSLAGEPRQ